MKRELPVRTFSKRVAFLAALWSSAGCDAPQKAQRHAEPEPAAEAACSSSARAIPERSAAIRRLLDDATHPGLEPLRHRLAGALVCFHDGPSVLVGQELRMDVSLTDTHAAARVAHLLHHVEHPVWSEPDPRSCEMRVAAAIEREAAAWGLELQLGRQLAAGGASAYGFETEYWQTPAAERSRYLSALFEKGADPSRGVPPLVESYRARCGESGLAVNRVGALETR